MRKGRKWIALLLAGILISSQVANTFATNVSGGDSSFFQTVTGGDIFEEEGGSQNQPGESMGDVSGDDALTDDDTVSDGNGEDEGGIIPFLAKFFSNIMGRTTISTQSENTSLTGSKYSYSMNQADRPEFLDLWKLTVRNQEGGYVPGIQNAGSIYMNYQLYVSDTYMEEKLTEFQEDPSFPVPTGDIEASSKAVDDWLTANHANELTFTYSFPKEVVCGDLVELNKEYVLKTNQDGEVIGRYTISESADKANLEMKVSLEAILYNRYGTEFYFGFQMGVDGTKLTGDDPMEGKFDKGNLIFDKAANAGDGDGSGGTAKKYTVEKTAPVKVDTPYIDYVIQVEGTEGTGTAKKSLGGTELVDTLPVLGGNPLEIQSLSYEYQDSQGQTVKTDGVLGTDYTIDGGKLRFKFPKAAMEEVFQASVSLRLALSKSQYEDSVKNNVGIDVSFKNSAVLEDAGKKELSLPSEADTKMQWTFLNKTGTPGSVNGRYFDWKIELNTRFNHAGYAYLIDTINEDVHQYMFSQKNPLTITVDKGKEEGRKFLSYPTVEDKTAEINALIQEGTLSGDFIYEQYVKGSLFADVKSYLTAIGEITAPTPFYYTYQENVGGKLQSKSLMVIPVKVINTPGSAGVGETNFVDLTNSAVTVQYTTQLNLDKWGGDVNAYLQDTARPADKAKNEAKFVYDKYYYGSGIGNDIDIDEVSLNRELDVAAVYVEKSGVKYEPKTQKVRWKFQVNRVGGELLDATIADDLAVHGMVLENISYRIIQIGEQTASAAQNMNQGADQPKPNYTYNSGVATISLDSMDKNTSYEIWLDAKVTDQTKLKQSGSISLSNSASGEVTQQNGTIVPASMNTNIPIQNQWIEKKAIGGYDHSDKSFTWQITVNPNFLTVNNGKITDFLPELDSSGIKYPFTFKELKEVEEITLESSGQETSRKGTVNGSSFVCDGNTISVSETNGRKECEFTFSNPITKKYIFTFTTDISPADLENWMKGQQDDFVETVFNKVQLTGQVADQNGQNPADITSMVNGVPVAYSEATAANKLPAGILDKTGTFNSEEGTISWKILLNKQGIDLAGMTIVEDLTAAIGSDPLTHELLENTVKVYQGTADSSGKISYNEGNLITDQITKRILNATQADEDSQKNGMFKGTSYGFELDIKSGDTFSTSPLVITFDTVITGDKEKPSSLRNYIWMKDGGNNFQNSEQADGKSDQEVDLWKYSQTFKRPILQVYKHSVNSENLSLPGAVFELYEVTGTSGSYNVASDSSKKGKTLDNGYVYFMNLKENVIYQIKETTAPIGYSTAPEQYVVFQTKDDNTAYGSTITAGGVTGDLTVIKQQSNGIYKYPAADKSWIPFADETDLYSSVNEIKFTKEDPDGNLLEGSVFKLQRLKSDGTVDDSWGTEASGGKRYMTAASNASGEVIFNNVDAGDYLITETGAEDQWQIGGKLNLKVECQLVGGSHDYDYTITLHENEKKLGPVSGSAGSYVVTDKYITGTVKLMKTDAVAGKAEYLKGAEFKIYTKEAYDDYVASNSTDAGIGADSGTISIAAASSNDKGVVSFSAGVLEYGREYMIVETKSPKGYQQVTDMAVAVNTSDYTDTDLCTVKPNQSFTLSYAASSPFNAYNVTNERRVGTVSFTKQDGNGQPLAGRKFVLSCSEQELNAVTSNSYFSMKGSGGSWDHTAQNAPISENGESIWGYYQLASSDASGVVSFTDVPYGSYKVIELPATSGLIQPAALEDNYDVSEAKWTINMSQLGAPYTESGVDSFQCKGGKNGSETFANKLKTVDLVVKRVSWDNDDTNFNGDYVKDISFTLTGTDYEGKQVTITGTANPDGSITLKNIPVPSPGGEYILTESFLNGKPTGFDTDTKYDVTVELKPSGEAEVTTVVKSVTTPDGTGEVNQDRDPDTGSTIDNNFTIQSTPYVGSLTFGKIASLTQPASQTLTGIKDKPLSHVTFHLYAVDQNDVKTKIKTAVSTENSGAGAGAQNIVFSDIVFGNKYVITEEVPVGFQVKNTDNVTVNGDGSTEVTVMTLIPEANGVNGWSFNDVTKNFTYTQPGNISNTLIQKSIKITKTDQEGNVLKDRQYSIYRRSSAAIAADGAGMSIAQPDTVTTYHPYLPVKFPGGTAGHGVTAADGTLALEGLPYGDYLLIEELGPDVQAGTLCEVLVQVRADGIKVFENENTSTPHTNYVYNLTQPLNPDVWKELTMQGPTGGFDTCTVTNRIKFGYLDLKKETAELRSDSTLEKTEFARPLPGVRFQIFTADKNDDVYTKNSATPYLTLETNDQGVFLPIKDTASADYGAYTDVNGIDQKRLLCGHYIAVESQGMAGYAMDNTERGFTISPDVPNETKVKVTTNIAAAPAGSVTEGIIGNAVLRSAVTLFKKDKDSNINGAQKDAVFEVWTDTGTGDKLVGTLRYENRLLEDTKGYCYVLSDLSSDGSLHLKETDGKGELILYGDGGGWKLLPGEYAVKEVQPPDGYEVRDEFKFKIELGVVNGIPRALVTAANGNSEVKLESDGSITLTQDAINIKIAKQDEQGNILTGAQFKVTGRFSGRQPQDDLITLTLEDANKGRFIAGETYGLEEAKAPDGYKAAAIHVPFSVNKNGEVILAANAPGFASVDSAVKDTIQFINDPIELGIRKTDMEASPIDAKYGMAVFEISGVFADGQTKISVTADGSLSDSLRGKLIGNNTYSVKEVTMPKGYQKAGEFTFTVQGDGSVKVNENGTAFASYVADTAMLSIKNAPVLINVLKQGSNAEGVTVPLNGAEFKLEPRESTAFADGSTKELTFTTAEAGKLALEGICTAGGIYLLTESKAPGGYQTPEVGTFLFKVTDDGKGITILTNGLAGKARWEDQTNTLTVTNDPTRFSVSKRDDTPDKNRVADAQLSVYEWNIQQEKEGKLSYEFTTGADADEDIKFLPEGVYCIKETERPTGYKLADTVYFKMEAGRIHVILPDGTPGDNSILSADASGNPLITVTDQVIKGSFTLEKQYQDSADTISGLVFTMYDSQGLKMYDCMTDDKGQINLKDLAEGSYVMKENLAESRKNKTTDNVYIDEAAEYKIEVGVKDGTAVTVNWNGTAVGAEPVIVKNSRLDTSVSLFKYDNTDKAQIEDTEFKLEYRRDDTEPWTTLSGAGLHSTDSQGNLQIGGLIIGEYRLTESKAHKAYELETGKAFTAYFTVTNQEHGKDIVIDAETLQQGLYSMSVENASLLSHQGLGNIRKTGQVSVLKRDGDTLEGLNEVEYTLYKKQESGNWLADVWNYLTGKGYDKAGSIDGEVLSREGSMTMKGLEWGSYYLTETKALPGYKLDQTKYEFVIGRDGVDYTFLYENQELYNYKNSFTIQKTGRDGVTKLQGARFAILHSRTKNIVWEGTIDGELELEGLLTGGEEYILRELKAPDGYILADDIRFTMSDTGEISIDGKEAADNIIIVPNDPIEITLIKRTSSKSAYRLEGAKFLLRDVTPGMEGGAPVTVIPDAEGKIMEGLVQGHTYTLEETEAPAGYLLPPKEAVLTFTVTPQGKAVFEPNSFWEGTDTDTVYAFNDPIVVKVIKNSPEGNPLPGCVFRVTGEFAPVPAGSEVQGMPAKAAAGEVQGMSAKAAERKGNPVPVSGMEAASAKAIEELIVDDEHRDILEGRLLVGSTYTVKEMHAPDGYKVGGEVSFTVNGDGSIRMEASHEYTLNEDGTIVMVDQPFILRIHKTDMQGNGLDGAEFTLDGEFADGSLQKQILPQKDGLEVAAMLSGGQDYVLTEVTAPSGYVKASGPITIHVDYDGSMRIVEGSDTELAAIEHSQRASILTFQNKEVQKHDESGNGGQNTELSSPDKPEKGLGIVKTGDNSAIPVAVLVLGIGLILFGISFRRKKGNGSQQ